ncbi:MAG: flagellar assembly protein FliW [Eubacterium sp.]|jgi:flagellar assembly factor FliW|uniref:Flagellar assembly factor FliW n=1 Tax=Eubacterium cellulosolvens (strain ATCC 43171 / JCM 9499 / 6) TaxID=633697 RepID=I5ART6_EUBC6|nr:flagellar assembly protein FliW [Eubacterium sp.]
MLTLETKEYGTLEYAPEDIMHYPDGLFGFPDLHDYIPLCLNEEEDNTLLVLQSVDEASIGFVVINPYALDPDYTPYLTPEELQYLGVESEQDLTFYVICVLHENYLDNTVNLKCPLVVNPETRRGMQVILSSSDYDFRHKLSDFSNILGEDTEHADTETKEK